MSQDIKTNENESMTGAENVKDLFKGAWTIPNLMSFIRILLIPVFVVLYLKGNTYVWWAVAVLAISGISDFLDGKIARKFNQVSALGKMLDPVADKLTIFALAIVLYLRFKTADNDSMKAFAWVFLLFIIKDIIMIFFSIVMISLGLRPAAAAIYGKVATFVFYVVMIAIIGFGPGNVGAITSINDKLVLPDTVMYILVVLSVVLTFIAFFSYVPDSARQILAKIRKEDKKEAESTDAEAETAEDK
ncbi:MAG: CDP-alcohol phosphatidyltransferase family protein [Clostridiales bacterium]|nr:CDP-alcohol phosphatidyltransferase family protein [Clostridiales bacterium]